MTNKGILKKEQKKESNNLRKFPTAEESRKLKGPKCQAEQMQTRPTEK